MKISRLIRSDYIGMLNTKTGNPQTETLNLQACNHKLTPRLSRSQLWPKSRRLLFPTSIFPHTLFGFYGPRKKKSTKPTPLVHTCVHFSWPNIFINQLGSRYVCHSIGQSIRQLASWSVGQWAVVSFTHLRRQMVHSSICLAVKKKKEPTLR